MAVTQDSYEELSKTRLKTVYIPACIKASCWESVNDQTSHLSANQLSIITVAKYQKRKNIPLLVKAVAELVKKYPLMGFRLVIVGDLSIRKKSQDEFRRVKNLVKQYCLEDIIILRSNVSHKEMPAIYNQNNIFVLPAGSEPLGYAVLEAMASGKPVICSDQVGAVSYIEEGKNGYICEAGSLSSLVQSLEKFIRNNNEINIQKIEEFGRYGKTLVERNHSAGVFLNKFEELVCMK
ncbi:MAG: glycosyltransferase family 4 protein [Candidatus Andersenbacteria bacterium]|nr:glycosyltransferase family 4 protein [Candidatus Andersenbacteria bacterium]